MRGSPMRWTLISLLALMVAACAAGEPFETIRIDDIPKGPGLLTGDDGEFVIYRQ